MARKTTKKKTENSFKACIQCECKMKCCNFPKQQSGDGYQNICKACKYENSKKRKKKNGKSNVISLDNVRAKAKALCHHAKTRAKGKDLIFELDSDEIEKRLRASQCICEKTGIPFRFDAPEETTRSQFTPTLDRKIPSLGYTNENVQIVVCGYNSLKGEGTDMEALQIARKLIECETGN